jgi:uncharacterized protein YcsI (UPF0317 family)
MNFFGGTSKVYQKPSELRLACRSGAFKGHTTGQAGGYAQANICILPKEYAYDFLLFCVRNPKSCPLLHVLEAGVFTFGSWGKKVDIRTDLPKYRLFRDGILVKELSSLCAPSGDGDNNEAKTLWQDDFVTFVIGCSFSFEESLVRGGISMRHIDQGCNVPMYRTNIPTEKAGIFDGPLVVSMRPMSVADSIRAIEITARYPKAHGAPMYVCKPHYSGLISTTCAVPELGIEDMSKPDYGDPVEIKNGEVCVFWACGVTPQSVVLMAKPKICITHAPGCMLVLDTKNDELVTS